MTRTRTFDDRITTVLDGKRFTYTLDVVDQNDYHTWTTKVAETPEPRGNSTSGAFGSMTDVVTKNFKARQGQGEIINNPMTRTTTILEDSCGVYNHAAVKLRPVMTSTDDHLKDIPNYWDGWEIQVNAGGSYILGNPVGSAQFPDTPEIDVQRLQDLAVTQAYANVDVSQAKLLATLGESRETISSLSSIFARAVKIFRAVRKADFLYLRKQIKRKALEERYMEARYAIRPLIYDVQQITNAITKPVTSSNRMTFRGFASDKGTASYSGREHMRNHNFVLSISGSTTRTVEVRAGVLTQLDQIGALSNWGLDQPVQAMWEVTPWSFIADWFFNIGQVIASWTPKAGISTKASWCTITDIVDCACQVDSCTSFVDPLVYTAKALSQVDNMYVKRTTKSVTRVVNPNRSIIPSHKIRLDPLKILDLAIIGKSLFMGRPVKGYVKRS